MVEESCPDCGWLPEEGHAELCHVLWAEELNATPTNVAKRNPFIAMLKEPNETDAS